MRNIIEKQDYITDYYLANMECVPRPMPDDEIDVILPWNFANSVFAPYKPDNDALLNKCFEFDWEHSKIKSMVKDPLALGAVKSTLRGYYKYLREAFKYYGGMNPAGPVASIGTNVFLEILGTFEKNGPNSGLVDEKLLKMSEADLEFVATNAGTKMSTA